LAKMIISAEIYQILYAKILNEMHAKIAGQWDISQARTTQKWSCKFNETNSLMNILEDRIQNKIVKMAIECNSGLFVSNF